MLSHPELSCFRCIMCVSGTQKYGKHFRISASWLYWIRLVHVVHVSTTSYSLQLHTMQKRFILNASPMHQPIHLASRLSFHVWQAPYQPQIVTAYLRWWDQAPWERNLLLRSPLLEDQNSVVLPRTSRRLAIIKTALLQSLSACQSSTEGAVAEQCWA